jgi:hypothetical protein
MAGAGDRPIDRGHGTPTATPEVTMLPEDQELREALALMDTGRWREVDLYRIIELSVELEAWPELVFVANKIIDALLLETRIECAKERRVVTSPAMERPVVTSQCAD